MWRTKPDAGNQDNVYATDEVTLVKKIVGYIRTEELMGPPGRPGMEPRRREPQRTVSLMTYTPG